MPRKTSEPVLDGDEERAHQLAKPTVSRDGLGAASNRHYDARRTKFECDRSGFVSIARIADVDRDAAVVMLVSQALLRPMLHTRSMSSGCAASEKTGCGIRPAKGSSGFRRHWQYLGGPR